MGRKYRKHRGVRNGPGGPHRSSRRAIPWRGSAGTDWPRFGHAKTSSRGGDGVFRLGTMLSEGPGPRPAAARETPGSGLSCSDWGEGMALAEAMRRRFDRRSLTAPQGGDTSDIAGRRPRALVVRQRMLRDERVPQLLGAHHRLARVLRVLAQRAAERQIDEGGDDGPTAMPMNSSTTQLSARRPGIVSTSGYARMRPPHPSRKFSTNRLLPPDSWISPWRAPGPVVILDRLPLAQPPRRARAPESTHRMGMRRHLSLTRIGGAATSSSRPVTDRQLEILTNVARGRTNRQIGEILGISEKTVRNHLRTISHKLSTSDRTHAVVLAIGNGWIPIPIEPDGETAPVAAIPIEAESEASPALRTPPQPATAE